VASKFIGAMFALMLAAFALNMLALALHNLAPYLPVIGAIVFLGALGWFLYQRNRYY
jgi:hypothetical protein